MHNKLKNIAAELNALAEELECSCPEEKPAACCDTCTEKPEKEPDCPPEPTPPCAKKPGLQMPFKLPGGGNLLGGLLGGNMFGGLPKNLSELQQNPQMMQMLQNLSNNPQMLNAVSQMGGVDKEQILAALGNLNGDAAPVAPPTAAVPPLPTGTPHWQPESLSLKRGAAGGDPLQRLLNRWHWRY